MNLKQCLKQNDMIIPDYTQGSIIDVIRTIYQYCGYSYKKEKINENIKKLINNKKHIILILVDGMGSNLINSLSQDKILNKNRIADIITIFPTSTGCVLSSIATGEYPEKHGILGWYSYNRNENINYYPLLFKERKNGRNLNELNINKNDIFVYPSIMNKLSRKTTALFPEELVDSEFSKFTLNQNRMFYQNIENAFEKAIIDIQDNLELETFTYIYIPDVDMNSHNYGIQSQQVKKVLLEIEAGLVNLKEKNLKDTEIIVTADHGQIDITEEDIIMDFKKYSKYFYALPSVDFGTAIYYVKKEREKEFLEEFKKDFKNKMYIFPIEECINNNIFGNSKLSKYMMSNLGEYVSFCKKGAYFVNSIENPKKYIGKVKGSHSGFSKEEMIVPLILIET